MSKLWLEKKIFYSGEEGDQGVPFQKKVFPMYSNQLIDSRNVNFSIKKSQIHTHMLSLSQKLTKLDIAWKDKYCMGFWVWFPKNDPEWAFVYILYVFTAFSTPYWRLFCSAPSVVNLVSWSGKNWVGPCLYLEDLSQSLKRRWFYRFTTLWREKIHQISV